MRLRKLMATLKENEGPGENGIRSELLKWSGQTTTWHNLKSSMTIALVAPPYLGLGYML